MILPNFLCVGTVKGGTTTLHDILRQHPDIYLPEVKETCFFDQHYHSGIQSYQMHFSKYNGERAIGEIAPTYMHPPEVPKRILDTLGANIKLIFMLRDPIERAHSYYHMALRLGRFSEGFSDSVLYEFQRIQTIGDGDRADEDRANSDFLTGGQYATQIKQYLRYFPKSNMKFILFEEFVNNEGFLISEILEFLEVEPYELNYDVKSNDARVAKNQLIIDLLYRGNFMKPLRNLIKVLLGSQERRGRVKKFMEGLTTKPLVKPPIEMKTKELLVSFYKPEVQELEKLISKDLSKWLV